MTLIACTDQTSPQEANKVEQAIDISPTKPTSNTSSVPITYIEEVAIYPNFESIAPLFEQKTDTTYVINFWATWCKPCVEELPYFEQLTTDNQEDKIKVILVSLDFEKQLEKKLLPFLKERQLESKVVVLADGNYNNWIDKVDPTWSGAIPATFIYNSSKQEFHEKQFVDFDELNTLVRTFL